MNGYVEIDIFDFPEMHKPILDKNKKTVLGTFFSGYDSQALAYERLKKKGIDYELVCISEIDTPALNVHKALWGNVENLGAVGTFERLPGGLDIATWSFPCQDISNVGKQRGMVEGSRSNYGYDFLEAVRKTPKNERPKVLLMENVKPLISERFEKDLTQIKNTLKECGYENHIAVLNASDYGIPQGRERVFIVSILDGGYYEFPKPTKLTKTFYSYLEKEVDEKYFLKPQYIFTILDYDKGFDRKTIFIRNMQRNHISQTITTKLDRAESQYAKHPVIIDIKSSKNYSVNPSYTIAPTQYAQEHYGVILHVEIDSEDDIKVLKHYDELDLTICDIQGKCYIKDKGDYFRIRKLTEREAFRLMDVDEDKIDLILANTNKTNAYKLAGNSIVVSVLEKIFEQLY